MKQKLLLFLSIVFYATASLWAKSGNGNVTADPDISVRGNNIEIANGDITPSDVDNTIFSYGPVSTGPVVKTFSIKNNGINSLVLSGGVIISGTNSDRFKVTTAPSSSILSNGSTSFSITFTPLAIDVNYKAQVSIASNDPDKTPYTFSIQGSAVSGDGTSSNPYKIANLGNLNWISQNSSLWGNCFTQTADIDATDTKNWDSGQGFSPIGRNNHAYFSGTYDGKGYVIKNLYISRINVINVLDGIGLFGRISETGTVKNLGLSGGHLLVQSMLVV